MLMCHQSAPLIHFFTFMTSTAQNLTALLLLVSFFLSSCGEQKADADHWTPDLEQHVTGYTSGVISVEDVLDVLTSNSA